MLSLTDPTPDQYGKLSGLRQYFGFQLTWVCVCEVILQLYCHLSNIEKRRKRSLKYGVITTCQLYFAVAIRSCDSMACL